MARGSCEYTTGLDTTHVHLLTTKPTFGLYHYIVPYYMCRKSVYLACVCVCLRPFPVCIEARSTLGHSFLKYCPLSFLSMVSD